MSEETKKGIEKAIKKVLALENKNTIQMFNCYDLVGDYKECLFSNDEVDVQYCSCYSYMEIVGLNEENYNYFYEKYGY